MDEFFKKLGHMGGEVFNRGRWYWKSSVGDENVALKSEYILGKSIALDIISGISIDTNPELNELVQDVGDSLEYPLKNKHRKFHFYIQYTEDINAYALPGGFIFITYGLLNQIKDNVDELAFVLGHEMMHVVLRHPIQKVFSKFGTKVMNVVLSKYTKMGALSKQLLNQFIDSNYSQEKEFEADAGGLALMKAGGFEAKGARDLLLRIGQISKNGNIMLNYFSTHPTINERIKRIMNKVK